MERIIIDFAGWVELDPETATFIKTKDDSKISGAEYIKLSAEERGEYLLEDFEKEQSEALDGSFELFDISIKS